MCYRLAVFILVFSIVYSGCAKQMVVDQSNLQNTCCVMDGTRVLNPDTMELFLILDGVQRAIPSLGFLDWLFHSGLKKVQIDRADCCPKSATPLAWNTRIYLFNGAHGKAFYLVDQGVFRRIVSRRVFDRFDFNIDSVRDYSRGSILDDVEMGKDIQ